MYPAITQTIAKVMEYDYKHNIFEYLHDSPFHIHKRQHLKPDEDHGRDKQQDENWKKFEKHPGVYCVFDETGEKLIYVGMSKGDTGGRLFQWLFPKNDAHPMKVQKYIMDNDCLFLHIVLKSNSNGKGHDRDKGNCDGTYSGYIAPSLESYLIHELGPEINTIDKG